MVLHSFQSELCCLEHRKYDAFWVSVLIFPLVLDCPDLTLKCNLEQLVINPGLCLNQILVFIAVPLKFVFQISLNCHYLIVVYSHDRHCDDEFELPYPLELQYLQHR
jgi:hypothetical protein